jgi:DNA-binding Xre family transcriptional regulator
MTEEEFTRRLGRELENTRTRKGRSRQWLGAKVGLHRNSIERYEKGADIPVMNFLRICVALDTPSGEVLGRVLDKEHMARLKRELVGER